MPPQFSFSIEWSIHSEAFSVGISVKTTPLILQPFLANLYHLWNT